MKQIFIAVLVLAVIVTFLIFVKVQTLSMIPYEESSPAFTPYLDKKENDDRSKVEAIQQQADSQTIRAEPVNTLDPLTDAAIAYNAPKNAIVGEPITIILRIDPTATVEHIKQLIPDVPGDIIAKQIRVSQIIRAELTVDDTEFRLVNLSPNEQALFVSEPNIWQWELTALTAGTNHITISVTALVHVAGHDTNHFITAYSDDIVVTATTKQQIKALYDKHKDKLWGLLIVPAFEWARRRFNKWREEKLP